MTAAAAGAREPNFIANPTCIRAVPDNTQRVRTASSCRRLCQIHAEVRGYECRYMQGPQHNAHQDGMVEGFKGALRSSGCLWRLFWTSFGVFLQKVSVVPYTTYSYS